MARSSLPPPPPSLQVAADGGSFILPTATVAGLPGRGAVAIGNAFLLPPPPLYWTTLPSPPVSSDVMLSATLSPFVAPPPTYWNPRVYTSAADVISITPSSSPPPPPPVHWSSLSSPPVCSDRVLSAPPSSFVPPPRMFWAPQAPPFHGRVSDVMITPSSSSSPPPPPPVYWSPLSSPPVCSDMVLSAPPSPPPRMFWALQAPPFRGRVSDVAAVTPSSTPPPLSSPPFCSDMLLSSHPSAFAPSPRMFWAPQAPSFHGRASDMTVVTPSSSPTQPPRLHCSPLSSPHPGVATPPLLQAEPEQASRGVRPSHRRPTPPWPPSPPPTVRKAAPQGPPSLQIEAASHTTGIWQRRTVQRRRTSPCHAARPQGSAWVLSGGSLPMHRGGETCHGDWYAEPVESDEREEEGLKEDEEKEDEVQAATNSSIELELQPFSQGLGQHAANEETADAEIPALPPPPPSPQAPQQHQENAAHGNLRSKIRHYFDKPMVLFCALVVIYALYHVVFGGVSYLIKTELSKELQDKGVGNWIWGGVWLSTVPFFVWPHMYLYSHAVNVAAANRAAAANANPQQADGANGANEYRFQAVNANALMMFLGGGARILYMVVGKTWPLVTIAHAAGFVVEVIGLVLWYRAEGVLNIGLPQV